MRNAGSVWPRGRTPASGSVHARGRIPATLLRPPDSRTCQSERSTHINLRTRPSPPEDTLHSVPLAVGPVTPQLGPRHPPTRSLSVSVDSPVLDGSRKRHRITGSFVSHFFHCLASRPHGSAVPYHGSVFVIPFGGQMTFYSMDITRHLFIHQSTGIWARAQSGFEHPRGSCRLAVRLCFSGPGPSPAPEA